ncbi:PTN7-like protein [Mya arenaria]|uniref:PTN7-like protein n=1 Tax=Mya arenaria TaxID=6604 RepID=A0ABY7EHJ0_MYAAR|nr:PTN7-like protein [Mya arenaria]
MLLTDIQKFNAVYISGCKSEKDYILCFDPKPNNVNDFWTMVLVEEVDTIVMFSANKTSKKMLRYWPLDFNVPKNYKQVAVEVAHLNTEGLGYTVPFVVLDTYIQQLSDGSLAEQIDVYKMLVNIMKTRKDLLPSQELLIFTHECVQRIGKCDYLPLKSTDNIEHIESDYQMLHIDD